jgi:hypothetical protein
MNYKLKGCVTSNSTFFLALIYHPSEPQHYDDFNDLIAKLLSQSLPTATTLIGHDINADVGTKLTPDIADFSDVLRPHELNKRNEKGSKSYPSFRP